MKRRYRRAQSGVTSEADAILLGELYWCDAVEAADERRYGLRSRSGSAAMREDLLPAPSSLLRV